ncbi:WXG100 family type VII secretion target [Saccharopolyspora sp. K220]|uniref:WXG100 family type VII secretion target n=1 Tax=Saccharopolyspora soli TaxID=2926618 RepID=UPI001F5871EF|nr:WXG100 family type VII secretion target [Saccharopolyspora soli]MCI2417106.1 WXG100 family type VII secretion target [Saccharopolyspora soli]
MTSNAEAISENSALNPTASPVDGSAFGKLPFVKDIISADEHAGQGDVEALKGDIESYLSSATSFALDPMSFLIGTGVEFVINFVAPVRDAIQLVTGDSEALAKGAEAFAGVKGEIDQLAENLTNTLDTELNGWDGEAADALRKKMAKFIEGVQATGGQANNLSQLLQMSGTMMEAAEGVIKGILADFLTWAITTWITATATAGPTFGGSVAAATAATTAEAGITCARAAQQIQKIQKITAIIDKIMKVITIIKMIIDAIRIYESVQQITDGKPGGDGGKSPADIGSKVLGGTKEELGDGKGIADQVAKGDIEKAKEDGYAVDGDGDVARINPDGSHTKVDSNGDPIVDPSTGRTSTSQPADPSYGKKEVGWSALNNLADSTGSAADALEKQAREGGFTEVPPDKTISGNLDW